MPVIASAQGVNTAAFAACRNEALISRDAFDWKGVICGHVSEDSLNVCPFPIEEEDDEDKEEDNEEEEAHQDDDSLPHDDHKTNEDQQAHLKDDGLPEDENKNYDEEDDVVDRGPELHRSESSRAKRTFLDFDPKKKSYAQQERETGQFMGAVFQDQSYSRAAREDAQRAGVREYLEYCHNLTAQCCKSTKDDYEYGTMEAMLIARLIDDFNNGMKVERAESHIQQYILQKGLKLFGEKGVAAIKKEIDQLVNRECFGPISVKDLTQSKRRKAMEALAFLTEKRDGKIKGRMVYNGKPTREWLSCEESASPTVSLESIMLLAVIDAKEIGRAHV